MKPILLIEDEEILGGTIVDYLEIFEIPAQWIKSLGEFKEFVSTDIEVSIVVCDYHLLDADLPEVYDAFRESRLNHLSFLACSATVVEEELKYLEDNDIAIVKKPFDIEKLVAAIRERV
jgi:DNA-binding response OmpR family regulator